MTYYEMHEIHPIIEEQPININEVKLARMDEVIKEDENHSLLGTFALATCLCLIIADQKDTYLMHILDGYEKKIKSILNKLTRKRKCLIIPGLQTQITKITELTLFLKRLDKDIEIEVLNLSEFRNDEYESIEFVFDTKTKTFIKTDFDKLLGRGR